MELEEVKERLLELARISEEGAKLHPEDSEMFLTDKEALKTALNYIENSVSKDQIKGLIEGLNKNELLNKYNYEQMKIAIDILQDLLKEE